MGYFFIKLFENNLKPFVGSLVCNLVKFDTVNDTILTKMLLIIGAFLNSPPFINRLAHTTSYPSKNFENIIDIKLMFIKSSAGYITTALDLDNSKMYWSKNGVIQNSGTGQTIDNANSDFWTPITGNYNDASGHDTNFGNGVFGTTALTGTTYSDANSKGTFKYSPNDSGGSSFDGSAKDFYALITSNIKLYG